MTATRTWLAGYSLPPESTELNSLTRGLDFSLSRCRFPPACGLLAILVHACLTSVCFCQSAELCQGESELSLVVADNANEHFSSTDRWPMWGGTPGRNMVSAVKHISLDFNLSEGKNVAWSAILGSPTYGNPIVAGGKIFVGTNNAATNRVSRYYPKWNSEDQISVALVGGTVVPTASEPMENAALLFSKRMVDGKSKTEIRVLPAVSEIPADAKTIAVRGATLYQSLFEGLGYCPQYKSKDDKGVVLCFDQETGLFLWQLTREKLPSGPANDWPHQGICSAPLVEGDRMWLVTNRCELMCLDTEGFRDGENDGAVTDEVDRQAWDADIVWILDMIEKLNVFPHNLATSCPVMHGEMIYVLTGNGVNDTHLEVPSPSAPSFLAVNKQSGNVQWQDNSPGDKILHGQWGSPAIGVVNGRVQVYFPGGDGWLYALDSKTGDHIWRFDLNPKESKWELGGAGTRNFVIATPVFYDNSVFLAVGQDPEDGEGVGHLWRIDATKKGDISAEIGEIGQLAKPNPNSGMIWHHGGTDAEGQEMFRRTMSTVSIADGLVYAADLSGFIHCVDVKTGQRVWVHDLLSNVWGSTMVADGKVFIGNEDGKLTVLKAAREGPLVLGEFDTRDFSSIYTTPTFVGDTMYLTDRARLYAVRVGSHPEQER